MQLVLDIPVEPFPCLRAIVQSQIQECKNGLVLFLSFDLHGSPPLARDELYHAALARIPALGQWLGDQVASRRE
jgi:hypothetical protein